MSANRTFAVVLEPEDEGGFTVRVPAFPEIVTYGKDEREALAMAEDAIRLVIEDCVARGEPVPGGEPPRIREVTVTLAAGVLTGADATNYTVTVAAAPTADITARAVTVTADNKTKQISTSDPATFTYTITSGS